jgi:hypothetical protein
MPYLRALRRQSWALAIQEDRRCSAGKALKRRSISSRTKSVRSPYKTIIMNANRSVRLGPGKAIRKRGRVSTTYPYGEVPIATFILRYRTRSKSANAIIASVRASANSDSGDLEIEGIVERPVPLEERDPEGLTPDELREQVRLLRAAASKVKVKQEPKREKRARSVTLDVDDNDDGEDGDVTITGVSDRRKRAKASAGSIEVLDLTED